ncbi:uncharacterized protein LOC134724871 [Mytilus trossulus]|uniref:uncharacterized protein LOC134724871 n=1 Tax=Mytilus trossulus TaxID=6551 RepID=UPI003007B9BE
MCNDENRSNVLCGICIIIILLGLGITLIILGGTLDIIDLIILGGIFLGFGAILSSCIIVLIVRPLYNNRKIGYSATDLKQNGINRQESAAFSQHGGSVLIHDAYAGSADRQTVSSVMLVMRPGTTDSRRSDMFQARTRQHSGASSQASFVTAPDQNRDSLVSVDVEKAKSSDDEISTEAASKTMKHKVAFEEENSYVTEF